ncbi:MAG: hypothetical protein J7K78_02715 [Thaumarchaeota archaeon]|nr:hypothetical protein [Nitrososphaerota archaeon]
MVTEDGMLTKWERKILLDKLHGLEVKPEHLRAVKHRIKKRLEQAFRDVQLIRAIWPELVTGVTEMMRPPGFEPTNPYGTGALIRFLRILSPAPLTRLGYPRASNPPRSRIVCIRLINLAGLRENRRLDGFA